MSELWTPELKETPDVSNIFDMMLVFQDQLEMIGCEGGGKERWYPVAMFAVKALANQLNQMSEDERELKIAAEYVWVEAVEGLSAYVPYGEVGVSGTLVDVHGSIDPGQTVPQISLALYAESMYSLEDPDLNNPLQMPAIAPITKIRSIEQRAA